MNIYNCTDLQKLTERVEYDLTNVTPEIFTMHNSIPRLPRFKPERPLLSQAKIISLLLAHCHKLTRVAIIPYERIIFELDNNF